MCARGAQVFSWKQLFDHMEISQPAPNGGLERFNVSPSMSSKNGVQWTRLPVITSGEDGQRCIHGMIWPLIPFWCNGQLPKFSTANCRSEPDEPFSKTVAQKPAFRDAWEKNRRCLIPFSWFYEWDQRTQPKQPHMVSLKNDEIMAMAGLWDVTQTASNETMLSCTIVTTAPNSLLQDIGHHRCPAILGPNQWDQWLNGTPLEAQSLLLPIDSDRLKSSPVGNQINNPDFNEDPRIR